MKEHDQGCRSREPRAIETYPQIAYIAGNSEITDLRHRLGRTNQTGKRHHRRPGVLNATASDSHVRPERSEDRPCFWIEIHGCILTVRTASMESSPQSRTPAHRLAGQRLDSFHA